MGVLKRSRKPPSGAKTPILQIDALLECLEEEKMKPINAYRLLKWIIKNPLAENWDEIPVEQLELPHKMIKVLESRFVMKSTKIAKRFDSADGSTTKMLIELHDGEEVEAVIMRHEKRATLCVSSQVGCKMGCTFCATGTMGLRGNLSSGEILEQLLHAGGIEKIRNIVFMGMGEPLSNYDSVVLALRAMTDISLWSLKHGRVTVSTVGVIANMHKLTRDMPNISLALSLHAPTQEIREIIVPSANAHPLPKLLEALDLHLAQCKTKTKGAVAGMIEYILIAGVNDSSECAHKLGELLKSRNVMLNLIPYNDTSSSINAEFKAPSKESVDNFQRIIAKSYSIIVRVRREMGADIAGACGQLALTNKPDEGGVGDIEDFGGTAHLKKPTAKKVVKGTNQKVAALESAVEVSREGPATGAAGVEIYSDSSDSDDEPPPHQSTNQVDAESNTGKETASTRNEKENVSKSVDSSRSSYFSSPLFGLAVVALTVAAGTMVVMKSKKR